MKNTLHECREMLRELVRQRGLDHANVVVRARPLTPEEAIGSPGRRDFPILEGKERVIEANVMGQGKGFHDTNTYEWNEEYYQSGGRLISGHSALGGASYVHWLGNPRVVVGFRPLVIFPLARP